MGLTGCVKIKTNPRGVDGEEPTPTARRNFSVFGPNDTPAQNEEPTTISLDEAFDKKCTSAYISAFDWQPVSDSEDEFYMTVINQGDIAGEIIVQLTFYRSEDKEIQTGTTRRSVSIGSQETQDIVIRANPPTDDSNWVRYEVSQQACILDTGN